MAICLIALLGAHIAFAPQAQAKRKRSPVNCYQVSCGLKGGRVPTRPGQEFRMWAKVKLVCNRTIPLTGLCVNSHNEKVAKASSSNKGWHEGCASFKNMRFGSVRTMSARGKLLAKGRASISFSANDITGLSHDRRSWYARMKTCRIQFGQDAGSKKANPPRHGFRIQSKLLGGSSPLAPILHAMVSASRVNCWAAPRLWRWTGITKSKSPIKTSTQEKY
jgi:hypothetical protein